MRLFGLVGFERHMPPVGFSAYKSGVSPCGSLSADLRGTLFFESRAAVENE